MGLQLVWETRGGGGCWPTEKLVARIKMKDVKNPFSKGFKFLGLTLFFLCVSYFAFETCLCWWENLLGNVTLPLCNFCTSQQTWVNKEVLVVCRSILGSSFPEEEWERNTSLLKKTNCKVKASSWKYIIFLPYSIILSNINMLWW